MIKASGLSAATATLTTGRAYAAPRAAQTAELHGTAFGTGDYQYRPFQVPPGTNRVDVRIEKAGDAKTGLGPFDQRGAHYATLANANGFRGIYGEERGEFFVAADAASQSLIPGPIEPGEWTVIVPVFAARQPTPTTPSSAPDRSRPLGRPGRRARRSRRDRGDARDHWPPPRRGSGYLQPTSWLPPSWNQPYVERRASAESSNSAVSSYADRPQVRDPHALHFIGMSAADRYREMALVLGRPDVAPAVAASPLAAG